jgi:hypothetical protein
MIEPVQAVYGVAAVVDVRYWGDPHFSGACQFSVADSLVQVLRIQLPRDTLADYNDNNPRSF